MNRRTVLVVDDNKINRQVIYNILSEEYNIIEAENGLVGLSILRENYELISVVLLDIVMPVLDGYGVLEQIHDDPNISKIPVIVTSGQGGQDAEEKALALGANDYIVKPYKPAIIKHRIANTIYFRETASFVNSVQKDSLTGVLSKEYFYLRVAEMLRQNIGVKYDVVCCDIERFKLVNDLFGIKTGDSLLKHTASVLSAHIGVHSICGRIGADVFAFLTEHRDSYENAYFSKIVEEINNFEIKLDIMLRFGIFAVENISVPVSNMCDRACLAKNSIKGKYNMLFAYYDDAARRKLLDEQALTLGMEAALKENQFKVFFQPKYNIKTQKIAGAEALVRWVHPEKGFINPGDFIPLFERNGFITDLDIYIWDNCCQKIRAWIDKGNTPVPLSVNMSRADIYNPDLTDILLSMLKKYRLSPKYLHLEITETAYTENPEQLIDVVTHLKKLGFIIEMDDFGSGYSSLNMLSELPIDILKLDMKFMQNEKALNSRNILSFIISLAKWMNLFVIAEGVETEEQAHFLQSLNCEFAQGYFYAKPLPQDAFEALLLQSGLAFAAEDDAEAAGQLFAKGAENPLSTMLVLDNEKNDYEALVSLFQGEYNVVLLAEAATAFELIDSFKDEIAAFVINANDIPNMLQVENLHDVSTVYHIPILLIQNSLDQSSDEALCLGVSDCLSRPYTPEVLRNRVYNIMCRALSAQYRREKEINSVILEMKKRAEQDSLTGLLNRAELEVRITDFFKNNKKPEGIFIILDIDNFKNVNDTFGHVTGDRLLCAVARELNSLFAETNIVSRMGGDEFAVFIPYKIAMEELQLKIEQLCHSVTFDVENISVTCSAGVCISPENGMDYAQLYGNADVALLAAKRSGKSKFIIYTEELEEACSKSFDEKTMQLLDGTTEAMFVSDAVTSEIVYINDTACHVVGKSKKDCFGKRCYQLFWDTCRNCDRCMYISDHTDDFYEEDTFMKDHKTKVHIKAKLGEWDGRKVKIHYLLIK